MRFRLFSFSVYLAALFYFAACSENDPMSSEKEQPIDEAIAVTVDLNSSTVVEAGREWVDNSGITHVQGRVTRGEIVSGDLVGEFINIITADYRYDPATGNGTERLIVECEVTWPEQNLRGAFAGEINHEYSNGKRASSRLEAQGKEGFSGMKLTLSFQENESDSNVLFGSGHITEE